MPRTLSLVFAALLLAAAGAATAHERAARHVGAYPDHPYRHHDRHHHRHRHCAPRWRRAHGREYALDDRFEPVRHWRAWAPPLWREYGHCRRCEVDW